MWWRTLSRSLQRDIWNNVTPSTVWFHAASTGETKSVASLVQKLHPKFTTIISNRSARALDWEIPEVDAFARRVLAPNEWRVDEFLQLVQPKLAIFVESELWPNLIFKTQCPKLLVNGRLSDSSFRRWSSNIFTRRLIGSMLGRFELIHAQTDDDAERFQSFLKPSSRHILVSNLKLANHRTTSLDTTTIDRGIVQFVEQNPPMWAAVSLHPGEEQVIIQAQRMFKAVAGQQMHKNALLYIIPRHPNRQARSKILEIEPGVFRLEDMGLIPFLSSKVRDHGLGLVFVGGSLSASHHKGGHNVMEPIRSGCAVVHGPHMSAFSDVIQRLSLGSIRSEVDSASELCQVLLSAVRQGGRQLSLSAADVNLEVDGSEAVMSELWNAIQRRI